MKKRDGPFVALVSSAEKELYTGGFGVAVVNGSISGGQVQNIEESAALIRIAFIYFGRKIGEELRFLPTYEMVFEKPRQTDNITRSDGCLILTENEESYLLLYPNSLRVLEKHTANK